MKPDNLKIINELVYEKQQLKMCPEGIAKGIEEQLQYVIDTIEESVSTTSKESEPPILYFDDEGQPINGIEPNGYNASEDELISWEELISLGLF